MNKQIDIQKQVRFGMARTVSITIIGVGYRLFRSMVTVVVIMVAVAFLINILSESLIKREIADQTKTAITDMRLAEVWAARLSQPGTLEELLIQTAEAPRDGPVYREMMAMGGFAAKQMQAYQQQAKDAAAYMRFFADLAYGQKRRLVRSASGTAILDLLEQETAKKRFWSELGLMQSLHFVTTPDALDRFLDDWPKTKNHTQRIVDQWARGIAKIRRHLGGRALLHALGDIDGAFGQVVSAAGFVMDDPTARGVASQAKRAADAAIVEATISKADMRRVVAARLDLLPSQVSIPVLWNLLDKRETAQWYLSELEKGFLFHVDIGFQEDLNKREISQPLNSAFENRRIFLSEDATVLIEDQGHKWLVTDRSGAFMISRTDDALNVYRHRGMSIDLSPERVVELAGLHDQQIRLAHAERNAAGVGGGVMGIGQRMTWLVLVSMMVCIVGIANAMLMSVTERFREIATLKCLGALDSTIMLMFVLEACMLGVVGGILGSALGVLIGLGRMYISFGSLIGTAIPFQPLLLSMAISTVMGVILAALAAVYPSFKAARLAPMEAMRIE